MATNSKGEFLKNVRNIINEGLNQDYTSFDATRKFTIKKYVNKLITEGSRNPNLMSVLVSYDNRIKNGEAEYLMFESFGHDISRYASGNKEIKSIIAEMNNTLRETGNELETFMVLETLENQQAKEVIKDAYNKYLYEKDESTRNNLVDALDTLYEYNSKSAERLKCLIADNTLSSFNEIPMGLNESEYADINKEIIKNNERKKMEDIKEKIMDYASEYFDNAISKSKINENKNTLSHIANNTGVNLRKAVNYIAKSDAKSNKGLMEHINQYAGALQHGLYEERLYETFLNTMSQYTYLKPVEKAIKLVNESVKKNKIGVTITKVLEEMSESMSYYIVPLIEEDCARFVKEPTPVNRVQMRNAIMPFAADPYVNIILNELEVMDTPSKSLTEKAMSIKDQIKLIRENANVTNIYSPIQYIKENESVFNVNGEYFIKKGNQILKFNEKYLNNLSEKFVSLCQLCNDPRVVIDEDVIYLTSGNKMAAIHEGYVDINGIRESRESLRDLNTMCNKYDYDTNFFVMASCLHENFDNIAKVGFAKHISLNNNDNVYADIFRLNDNIFINTINESLSQNTFYKNVNPIQCKNILNRHMGMNVSDLFEDLLPSQNKILLKLNETQNEYESAISKYEDTIDKMQEAKGDCKDDSNKKKLDDAIKEAQKKLTNLKNEYKKWQKEAKKATGDDDDDIDDEEASDDGATREETTDEPLKTDKEVDDAMPDLTTPIEATDDEGLVDDDVEDDVNDDDIIDDEEGDDEDDEDFTGATDAEFADMLDGDDDEDNELEGEDDEFGDEEDEVAPEGEEGEDDINDVDFDDDELGDEGDEFDDEEGDGFTEMPDEYDVDDENDELDVEDDEDEADDVNDDEFDDEEGEPNYDGMSDDEDFADDDEEGENATDLFGGDIENPLGDEDEIEMDEDDIEDESAWEISEVRFDENLKTGTKYKSGNVTVLTPMISRAGDTYMETNNYEFYLDDETGEPVINNDEMEVTLYKQIISAIKDSAEYQDFVDNGEANPNTNEEDFFGDEDDLSASDEDDEEEGDDTDDLDSLFNFDDTDDAFTIEPKDDDNDDGDDEDDEDDEDDIFDNLFDNEDFEDEDENPYEAKVKVPTAKKAIKRAKVPTYDMDGTDVELPSADVDDTIIPESRRYGRNGRHINENRGKILGVKPQFNFSKRR